MNKPFTVNKLLVFYWKPINLGEKIYLMNLIPPPEDEFN